MDNTIGSIQLECKYKFMRIDSVYMKVEPNEHARAEVTGIIEEKTDPDIIRTQLDSFKIKQTGTEEILLFSGVIDEVMVKHRHGIYYITVKAYSRTIQLDIKKKRRSFQHKQNPYEKIMEQIMRTDHKGDFLDHQTKGKKQERVILQYDETDWEFMKRIASHHEAVVVADVKGERPLIHMGVPKLNPKTEPEENLDIEKQLLEYDRTRQNFSEKGELEHVSYKIKSDKDYDVGTDIKYGSKTLAVCKKEVQTEGGVLVKYYELRDRKGIYQNFYSNKAITGLSLGGVVLDVQRDTVKVHLDIDKKQSPEEAHWFPFTSSYTTEGQTGIYVMPEKKESVALYFPEAEENFGVIRSAIRKDGDKNKKTQDTKNTFFGTLKKKELKMTPEELQFTVKEGKMYLRMEDKKGIELKSDKEIIIKSKDTIKIEGKKISMDGGKVLCAKVGGSSIILDKTAHFKGSIIRIGGSDSGGSGSGSVVPESQSKPADGNYTGGRSPEELEELAKDPAHKGSKRPCDIKKGEHERKVGLSLEERGELAPLITRDPSGDAEFFDGNGQAWDVKSFNSGFPPKKGGYTLSSSMRSISESLDENENVILDTTNLSDADKLELIAEVTKPELKGKIIIWP